MRILAMVLCLALIALATGCRAPTEPTTPRGKAVEIHRDFSDLRQR